MREDDPPPPLLCQKGGRIPVPQVQQRDLPCSSLWTSCWKQTCLFPSFSPSWCVHCRKGPPHRFQRMAYVWGEGEARFGPWAGTELEVEDFETDVLPPGPSCISSECRILRSPELQRQLAVMCIQKAKLCVCMSHVLTVQDSVFNHNHGLTNEEGSTQTTFRLAARRWDPEANGVQTCDRELELWKNELPEDAKYRTPTWLEVDSGRDSIALNR